ncbi:MAG: methyltransferase domain-containing protein [Rhodobacteraceae bacterium]|nr:methyltransferase domain-containing protein [Paracoccaceae bacterium]
MSNDPYADLGNASDEMQLRLLEAMIARAEDPKQIAMRHAYLSKVNLPAGAKAVELGSGPGDVTRDLIQVAGAAEALGLEPSSVMVRAAAARHSDTLGLSFAVGDAKATGLADHSVDLVALHTLLIHCPDPEEAIAEAHRILKPSGYLTVFDEDPPSVTAAIADNDPFHPVVDNLIRAYVHDRWLVRRTAGLLLQSGFDILHRDGHLYLPAPDSPYFLTIIDRGADTLLAEGVIGEELAQGIRTEARRRMETGHFFGSIAFVGIIARKR